MDEITISRWMPRLVLAIAACLHVATLPDLSRAAEIANWSQPDMDAWFYVHGSGVGTRRRGPTYSNLLYDEGTQSFDVRSANEPARYGSTLFAFETSAYVEPLLAPTRYQVESVTMTAMVENGTSATESLRYEPVSKSVADHLGEYASGGPTAQQPMELFGVGFRGDLNGFALGPEQEGERFGELTLPYSDDLGGYVAYPVVGDESGGYRDVSNNVSGGFSATETSHVTTPFEATPWSIGTTNLAAGAAVPNFTTFEFSLDLDAPGVRQYVQGSLSKGALGFMLSSMHATEQFGGGTSPYPQWLMKEAVPGGGGFPIAGAEAATLAIEYTIVDDLLAGDFDGSGFVDHQDYAMWKSQFGSPISPVGTSSDGNADGWVNLADYTIWRNNLGAGVPPALVAGGSVAVPEPSGTQLIGALVLTGVFCGRVHWFVRPESRRR